MLSRPFAVVFTASIFLLQLVSFDTSLFVLAQDQEQLDCPTNCGFLNTGRIYYRIDGGECESRCFSILTRFVRRLLGWQCGYCPTAAPSTSAPEPSCVEEDLTLEDGYQVKVGTEEREDGGMGICGTMTIPLGDSYQAELGNVDGELSSASFTERKLQGEFQLSAGSMDSLQMSIPGFEDLLGLLTEAEEAEALTFGMARAGEIEFLDLALFSGAVSPRTLFYYFILDVEKLVASRDGEEGEPLDQYILSEDIPDYPVDGVDDAGSIPPSDAFLDVESGNPNKQQPEDVPPPDNWGPWLFRVPTLYLAVEPNTPIVYFETGKIFADVPIAFPIGDDASLPVVAHFYAKDIVLGYATEDSLSMSTSIPVMSNPEYSIIPTEISGNLYITATIGLMLSSPAFSNISAGFSYTGLVVADVDIDYLLGAEEESQFVPPSAFKELGLTGDANLYLNLLSFDVNCPIQNSTVYYANRTADSKDFALAGGFELVDSCHFGPLGILFNSTNSPVVESTITLYAHVTTDPPEGVPATYVEGIGDMSLNIEGQEVGFSSAYFLVDSGRDLIYVRGEFDFPFFPSFYLEGELTSTGGALTGTVEYSYTFPWGTSIDTYIETTAGISEEKAFLSFSATISFVSGLGLEGGFNGTLAVDVLVEKTDDGEFVLIACFDGTETSLELLSYAGSGVGNSTCIDFAALRDGVSNGGTCVVNSMCQSGRCQYELNGGELGEDLLGTCQPKLGIGADCNQNMDCLSGRCELNITDLDSFGSCTEPLEIGSRCTENSDCTSGRCEFNSTDLSDLFGRCEDRLADGALCNENSDCVSENCFLSECRPEQVDNGLACLVNDDCLSGRCESNSTSPTLFSCAATVANGGDCNEHTDCASGRCEGPIRAILVGGTCMDKAGPGEGCDYDADCISDDCVCVGNPCTILSGTCN